MLIHRSIALCLLPMITGAPSSREAMLANESQILQFTSDDCQHIGANARSYMKQRNLKTKAQQTSRH